MGFRLYFLLLNKHPDEWMQKRERKNNPSNLSFRWSINTHMHIIFLCISQVDCIEQSRNSLETLLKSQLEQSMSKSMRATSVLSTHADLPSLSSLVGQAPFFDRREVTLSASPCSTALRRRSSFLFHSWAYRNLKMF